MDLKDIDRKILACRRMYHNAGSTSEALHHLRHCNQWQHKRWQLTGKYLTHSNERVYVYDTGFQRWTAL